MVSHPDIAPSLASPASVRVVVMGVAGCGKSEIGKRIAGQLGLPFVEGDDYHAGAIPQAGR